MIKAKAIRITVAAIASLMAIGGGLSMAAELNLKWRDNSSNEDGFSIERSIDGMSFAEIARVGRDTNSYRDSNLETRSYWYRVRAFNLFGYSGYTNIARRVAVDRGGANAYSLFDEAPFSYWLSSDGKMRVTVNSIGPNLSFQWYRGESGDSSEPVEAAGDDFVVIDNWAASEPYWVRAVSSPSSGPIAIEESETFRVDTAAQVDYYFGTLDSGGECAVVVDGSGNSVLYGLDASGSRVIRANVEAPGPSARSTQGALSGGISYFADLDSSARPWAHGEHGVFEGGVIGSSGGKSFSVVAPSGRGLCLVSLGGSAEAYPIELNASNGAVRDSLTMQMGLDGATVSGVLDYPDGEREFSCARTGRPGKARLVNSSVRGRVMQGDEIMIAGLSVGGNGGAEVVIRGVGPALNSLGIEDFIRDPRLKMYRQSDFELLTTNDGWDGSVDLSSKMDSLGAFPFERGSEDTAFSSSVSSGSYTFHLENIGLSGALGLLEVYDLQNSGSGLSAARVRNLSTRSFVGRQDEVLIGGVVVSGVGPIRLLVRAVGPELESQGVEGALSDPKLELYSHHSEIPELIASNRDWNEDPRISEVTARVGAFPLVEDSGSAGMIIWLDRGVYSVITSPESGENGIALFEVYQID